MPVSILFIKIKRKTLFKTNRLFPGYNLINLKAFHWTNTMIRFYEYHEDADLCVSGDTRFILRCVQSELGLSVLFTVYEALSRTLFIKIHYHAIDLLSKKLIEKVFVLPSAQYN